MQGRIVTDTGVTQNMASVEKKPRVRKSAAETKSAKKVAAGAKATATPKATPVAFGPEHVAERAYYLWESGAEGDSLEHWLRAERELKTV
ncbi:MAG TPA: DUF2934 domain-containing protein [Gaiellaceae bacterium]|nr:DUF2934 domain-containing protein [Gaiellaceae bacterium]